MARINKFEEIEAWQTARELTNLIYDLSDLEPFARDFGLRDQIRRASVSVMSNIAEGFESHTQALFLKHLGYARGSAAEVRSQLYVAMDRLYISQAKFDDAFNLADKAARQISRFMSYLRSQGNSRRVREGLVFYDLND